VQLAQDEGDDKGEQRPNQHCARFYQATHRFNLIILINQINL
jgi:hypothetical protein